MIALIVITTIGFIFRLISSNQSLWLDEAASVVLARLSLGEMFSAIAADFHPPLFYLLLKIWLPFAKTNEMFLRLPNIIFGTLSIPAIFFLTRLAFSARKKIVHPAFLASLLLALNPLAIYYSIELRMYSLNLLLGILSWFCLLSWLKTKRQNSRFLIIFQVINLTNIYLYYGSFFNLVAQFIFILWTHRQKMRIFVISFLPVVIGYLFWLPLLFKQLAGGHILTRALPEWSALSGMANIKSLVLIFAKISLGRIPIGDTLGSLALICAILLYHLFHC